MKQSRIGDHFIVNARQEQFYCQHPDLGPCSIKDLLQCDHSDLVVNVIPKSDLPREVGSVVADSVSCRNGFWYIDYHRDLRCGKLEFTVGVAVGKSWSFHADYIKRYIENQHGSAIYSQWRSMILNDLPCLERLVDVVRSKISDVALSTVCCESSARLCRRVGIPVRNGIAFLFPTFYC